MGVYFLDSFDWEKFHRHIDAPATELTPSIVRLVAEDRTIHETAHSLLPPPTELADFVNAAILSKDWYDGDVDAKSAMDDLVDLMFAEPVRALFDATQLGEGVDSMVADYARGILELGESKDMSRFRKAKQRPVDPESEFLAFGSRPHRTTSWQPEDEDEEFNPFLAAEPVYYPSYSIHSPDQVERLASEVSAVDISAIREQELRHNFEKELLVPLEETAEERRALRVVADN